MSLNSMLRQAKCSWHGVKLHTPDWTDRSHSVACTAELLQEGLVLHLILNAYWEPLEFELPQAGEGRKAPWHRWIDTALESPHDIVHWKTAPPVPGSTYRAEPRSVVVLFTGRE
jgi:glycogen operon protein